MLGLFAFSQKAESQAVPNYGYQDFSITVGSHWTIPTGIQTEFDAGIYLPSYYPASFGFATFGGRYAPFSFYDYGQIESTTWEEGEETIEGIFVPRTETSSVGPDLLGTKSNWAVVGISTKFINYTTSISAGCGFISQRIWHETLVEGGVLAYEERIQNFGFGANFTSSNYWYSMRGSMFIDKEGKLRDWSASGNYQFWEFGTWNFGFGGLASQNFGLKAFGNLRLLSPQRPNHLDVQLGWAWTTDWSSEDFYNRGGPSVGLVWRCI